MKLVGQWAFVIVILFGTAYYLNWVVYQPAAAQDGSLKAVLRMAMKWYGLPLVIPVQLAIWWAMPTLFALTPSLWIASLAWPLASAICKVIVIWGIQPPAKADLVVIGGMFVTMGISWWMKNKG